MNVSKHITLREASCNCGCGRALLMPQIVYLFEEVREDFGVPLMINSGFRCQVYQLHLMELGLTKAQNSPHVSGAALDISIPYNIKPDCLKDTFIRNSKRLGFGKCRIGMKKYKNRFIHVDLAYLFYEPYTSIKNPNPKAWKEGVTW